LTSATPSIVLADQQLHPKRQTPEGEFLLEIAPVGSLILLCFFI
jgi:hypothetical protein